MSNQNYDYNKNEDGSKKKMSTTAKVVSIATVLLLLGGLVFAIFAYVDHSNKAKERMLNEQKQEQKEKASKRKCRKREKEKATRGKRAE
ncbi:hypothetical protein CO86_2660 [Staphylococcus aureus subsp. aureus CO-86]|nr:hypothetical protein CO86_2660 [Staphylococcus aureus subsp. aureus CO-86]QLI00135.1 hypothetical protein SA950122_00654 [Staphylococcus aureus]